MTEYTRRFARVRAGKNGIETGDIGTVQLVAPDGPWAIRVLDTEGKVIAESGDLPQVSVLRLLDQSLSPLTDSYAGKVALADARAEFAETAVNIATGQYRQRGGGGSVDPVTAELRAMLGRAIRAADGKRPDKRWPAIQAMEPAEKGAALDALFAEQPAKVQKSLRAQAEAAVEKRRAEREAEAAATSALAV